MVLAIGPWQMILILFVIGTPVVGFLFGFILGRRKSNKTEDQK